MKIIKPSVEIIDKINGEEILKKIELCGKGVSMINCYTKYIADYYGLENQKKKACEELAELIQAICKGNEEHIIEEIADVTIMAEQLIYLMKIDNMVKEVRNAKVARQMRRIAEND